VLVGLGVLVLGIVDVRLIGRSALRERPFGLQLRLLLRCILAVAAMFLIYAMLIGPPPLAPSGRCSRSSWNCFRPPDP
jgi:hypothetical protein